MTVVSKKVGQPHFSSWPEYIPILNSKNGQPVDAPTRQKFIEGSFENEKIYSLSELILIDAK
jgi:hypothetical protein